MLQIKAKGNLGMVVHTVLAEGEGLLKTKSSGTAWVTYQDPVSTNQLKQNQNKTKTAKDRYPEIVFLVADCF